MPLGLYGQNQDPDLVSYSPDHKRYFIAVSRGDLNRNSVRVDFLSGLTDSLVQARPKIVATLYTTDAGQNPPTHLATFHPHWLDNRYVGVIWSRDREPSQLVRIDAVDGGARTITASREAIADFAASPAGRIVYASFPSQVDRLPGLLQKGFSVPDDVGALQLLTHHGIGGPDPWYAERMYLIKSDGSTQLLQTSILNRVGFDVGFSPSGRYAIISVRLKALPSNWKDYTDGSAKKWPDSVRVFQRLEVVDLLNGNVKPLWDTPFDYFALGGLQNVLWSPDEKSVLLAGTFLPPGAKGARSLQGTAVAEVELSSGKYFQIPIALPGPRQLPNGGFEDKGLARAKSWQRDGTVIIAVAGNEYIYRKWDGSWKLVSNEPRPLTARGPVPDRQTVVGIEVRQALNVPPALYAVDSSGRTSLLFDPTPELRRGILLGKVSLTNWRDSAGRKWAGRLYLPVGYDPKKRYPLIIQTHGYSRTEFSLLGFEYVTSTFAAQPLANCGFVVLQMDEPLDKTSVPAERRIAMGGIEGAVRFLARANLIDPRKVGLVSFSRTGADVMYTLTHSKLRFGAAVLSDSTHLNYSEWVLRDDYYAEFERLEGGPPYGTSLKAWTRDAPGFNLDKM
jgi:dipeptidyl aminopeptidase/acylaminoacyl peptidase